MTRTRHFLFWGPLLFTLLVVAACGTTEPESAPTPASDTPPVAETQQAAVEPEPSAAEPDAPAVTSEKKDTHHGHSHKAPHGGVLVELGDHFAYLEFVFAPDTGTLTMYVLDGEAEKARRVTHETVGVLFTTPEAIAARPFELQARANLLTGETVGDSSQFVLTNPAFVGLKAFEAKVIEIRIKGQSLRDVAVTWPDDHE